MNQDFQTTAKAVASIGYYVAINTVTSSRFTAEAAVTGSKHVVAGCIGFWQGLKLGYKSASEARP